MKDYLRIVMALVITVVVYGLMVPSLISMKDTGAVITGFALAFLTPPFIYSLYKGIFIHDDEDKK
ncbi:TPA: hypothetical protein PL523_004351 [Cronobacter turicensis]|nr:hypothetical protein [Cronobacter turicensis]HDI3035707.1 hypothetical protein [Cronobacter turicensis]